MIITGHQDNSSFTDNIFFHPVHGPPVCVRLRECMYL